MFSTFLLFAFLRAVSSSDVIREEPNETYLNLAAGNSLWTALVKNCQNSSSMSCVERNMYSYLRETLDYPEDLQVTSFLKFAKNRMNYSATEEAEESDEEPRSAIEDMSRSLHGRSVNFFMNHDMEVQLPEGMFRGSILKVSPRGLEDNGALVKLEVVPRDVEPEQVEGRILLKKIKKFVSEKLIYALMAILLVIKLIAAKFMFFLPMMVGAVTAKKLLVKVLLFLFPALNHLFKLCAYTPHGAKLHHHKHHIQHYHHVPHKPNLHHHHHDDHEGVEIIRPHSAGPPQSGPWHGPSLHHHIELEEPHKPLYTPHEHQLEYYSDGPGVSHQFINDREDSSEDTNEVQAWGQGQRKKPPSRPSTPTEIEAMVVKAEREAVLKQRLQQERQKIQEENSRLQDQLRQAMQLQEKLKQQAAAVKARLPVLPPSAHLRIPATEHVYSAKVKQEETKIALPVPTSAPPPPPATQSPFEKALHQAATITYDPFYSPILEKIDKILAGLKFQDKGCRERLICSMYKNPTRFSPHSNLLSAELSRDSSELQKPTTTNAAVIRFYRYVQAARDGQDRRECLRLYPTCSINTELVK